MTVPTLTIAGGALRDQRRPFVAWSIAVAAVAALYTVFYPSIGATKFELMLDAMPEFARVLGFDAIVSAAGYVGATVYSLLGAILVLVFAIGLGARLIAGDEEAGVLELDFSAPVSRARVYLERLAVLWLGVLTLVASLTVMLVVLSAALDLELSVANVLAASTGLLLFAGALGTVAFAVGAATGRRAHGLGAAAGLAVLAYVLNYLSPLLEAPWLQEVSPFGWYIGAEPLMTGFAWEGFWRLGALAVAAAVAAWPFFARRDLMV